MAELEAQLRGLAAAIVDEYGEDAHQWTKRLAAHFRTEGDHMRAGFWEDVALQVLQIQSGLKRRRYL